MSATKKNHTKIVGYGKGKKTKGSESKAKERKGERKKASERKEINRERAKLNEETMITLDICIKAFLNNKR